MSDTRLARMMHVLVHMHLLGGSETSEVIARMLNTNPVVVRRTMGLLRDAGLVSSAGGRSGGWSLAQPAETVTMLDVHRALTSQVFAISCSNDHPNCPVEQTVNHLIGHALHKAEAALSDQLSRVTIEAIAQRYRSTG
ncbi:RrF2 family transcriptional regulator [Devosia albogilva]|uniref:RrF2 family transcriptional regulator n=1 Tax=Devosia albogilva TaxID=429726 RepID=A0ABW5QG77_9HYPH